MDTCTCSLHLGSPTPDIYMNKHEEHSFLVYMCISLCTVQTTLRGLILGGSSDATMHFAVQAMKVFKSMKNIPDVSSVYDNVQYNNVWF